jgi:hypothetical protein
MHREEFRIQKSEVRSQELQEQILMLMVGNKYWRRSYGIGRTTSHRSEAAVPFCNS